MTKLTENFTLEELCVTDTGASNIPDKCQSSKLQIVASTLLQPTRNKWGRIKVNSGFRSLFVNDKIGGSATSQHPEGEAVDFVPLDANIDEVFQWCRSNLIYGQIILETKESGGSLVRWIHCSLPRIGKQNQQALLFLNGKYDNA